MHLLISCAMISVTQTFLGILVTIYSNKNSKYGNYGKILVQKMENNMNN